MALAQEPNWFSLALSSLATAFVPTPSMLGASQLHQLIKLVLINSTPHVTPCPILPSPYCSDKSLQELAASGCLFYTVQYNRTLFSFSFPCLLTLHLGFTLKRGRGPYVIVRRGVPEDPWRGILARYVPISVSTVDELVGEGSLLPSIGRWLLFGGRPLPQLFFGGWPPLLAFGGTHLPPSVPPSASPQAFNSLNLSGQYFTIPHIIYMDSTGLHWTSLDFTI